MKSLRSLTQFLTDGQMIIYGHSRWPCGSLLIISCALLLFNDHVQMSQRIYNSEGTLTQESFFPPLKKAYECEGSGETQACHLPP